VLEATYRPRRRHAWYSRAELVRKDILSPGRHEPGSVHFHPLSRVGAGTLGYIYDLFDSAKGFLGLGGDVTAYRVDSNLRDSYGSPLSFHLFMRYRPAHPAHTRH
jgi:hypothetical protein